MIISATKCAKISEFRIKRSFTGIDVYHPDGYFSARDDDWREIIKQVSALLQPEKFEAQAEETPDPSGYVFIDRAGYAWGYYAASEGSPCAAGTSADRPFRTRDEAEAVAQRCIFGCQRIEVWTPESRVPPMPEKRP